MRSVQFITEAAAIRFLDYTQEVAEQIRAAAQKKAARIAMLIANEAKRGMAGQRAGRRYRVPGTQRYYTASRPGEYPANRTGRLRASIQIAAEVNAFMGSALAIVGATALYAPFLQYGTKFMQARPFLTLAYAAVRQQIDEEVRKPFL